MKDIPARDAKNQFGQFLDAAQRAPVRVTKKGRPAGVMMPAIDGQSADRHGSGSDWREQAFSRPTRLNASNLPYSGQSRALSYAGVVPRAEY